MFFIESFLKQRERWVLWTPVLLSLGAGAYFSLHAEPPLWVGLLAMAALVAAASFFHKNRTAMLIWLPFFLIALGFTAGQWRTVEVAAPVLERKTYPLILEARVFETDQLAEGYRIILDQIKYSTVRAGKSLPQDPMPEKVRLKLKKSMEPPGTGDIVRVKAMLTPLSQPVLPAAYDFQRTSFFNGIGATGFVIGNIEVLQPVARGFFFDSLRRYLSTHVHAAMENSDAAAITTALLYGDDQDISKTTYDKIRAAGIAHLIAISGLQITLVTGFFFFVVRGLLACIPYVALRWPLKKITAFIAIWGAIFYLMLIGQSASAERSVIMVCMVMLAIMVDRDPFTLRVTGFAATVMLIFQPDSLFGPSFQMSFGAVVALISFYESTRDWWSSDKDDPWYKRAGIYILASFATTLVATAATAGISLYYFLRTTMLPGLAANLVAVPLSSFVTMPFGIIGCLLMPLGLEKIPLKVAEWSVVEIINTAAAVSQWPHSVYNLDAWPMWVLVMMTLGGLWICLWREKIRWLGAIPVVIGVILIPLTKHPDVLVSQDGKLFAARDEKTGVLWISSERAEKFVRDSWVTREAEPGHDFWPQKNGPQENTPVSCDSQACLYQHKGKLVSFVKRVTALERDCAEANVIITSLYIKRGTCVGPEVIISKSELKYQGAQEIYFGDDGHITVDTVRSERGTRPWAPMPKPYKYKPAQEWNKNK